MKGRMYFLQCDRCGEYFYGTAPTQRFCSLTCKAREKNPNSVKIPEPLEKTELTAAECGEIDRFYDLNYGTAQAKGYHTEQKLKLAQRRKKRKKKIYIPDFLRDCEAVKHGIRI